MAAAKAEKPEEKAAGAGVGAAKEVPPKTIALEEDDDFEEFAHEAWKPEDEDAGEADVDWQDDWDDADVDDDFIRQLRSELTKSG